MLDITIGADPEFFVRRGIHFIPAHIFECGTKEEPMETDHGSVQVDGVALECNVRPASTRESFVANCSGVMGDLAHVAQRVIPDAVLVARPSVFFGIRKLDSLPPHVKALGCTPDFNGYTQARVPRPNANVPFRTGSGHVHIGWTKDVNPYDETHFGMCCTLAKQLDYYLGLPSLAWDNDTRRRKLYGEAGAFRPKPYGMEYRTLSNAWLRSQDLMGEVFDRALAAVRALEGGRYLDDHWDGTARTAVNNNLQDWETRYPGLSKEIH